MHVRSIARSSGPGFSGHFNRIANYTNCDKCLRGLESRARLSPAIKENDILGAASQGFRRSPLRPSPYFGSTRTLPRSYARGTSDQNVPRCASLCAASMSS